MEQETLLTVEEVASVLGVNRVSVYTAIREDRLPFIKRYGKKLVRLPDLEAYKARTQPDGVKLRGRPRKTEAAAE